MTDESTYAPPKVWHWNKESGGRFAAINRPIAGPTHDKELPVGRHPLQLYSLATPNGVKVTVMLEELLALGHRGAEYDAWLIRIDGNQFGSGFVAVNPNSKIPALMDRSGPKPIRVFESGAILLHLAEKFGALAADRCREHAPNACRGCSGRWAAHPISAAALVTSTPMRRPRSNTPSTASRWRSSASSTCSTAASPTTNIWQATQYTIADIAVWPWYGALAQGLLYGAGEFLDVQTYTNVLRWTAAIAKRPAARRGRMVNRVWGDPSSQLHERHDASDFETKTQDKIGAPAPAS